MIKKQLDNSIKNHIINLYDRDYKITEIVKIYKITERDRR